MCGPGNIFRNTQRIFDGYQYLLLVLVSSGPPLLSEINITTSIHLCYRTKILISDVAWMKGGVARVSAQRISDGYQLLSSGPPLLSEKTLSLCNLTQSDHAACPQTSPRFKKF
jgi:hypothetical protein